MPPISKELYNVLVAWREDAMSDEPKYSTQNFGLCCHVIGAISVELADMFRTEFGKTDYPFDADADAYNSDCALHLNPRRRAWVDAKIAEYEAAQVSEVAAS